MKILKDLKHFIKRFDFLRAYNSPFKAPKIKWYFGKIALGTPYFLPRKWVKFTPQDAIDKATEYVNDDKYIKKSFEEWYASFLNYRKAVPKKIGFDFVPLGWKTKYDMYRFECSPRISFVFFKWQIAVTFVAPHLDHYWESWLYYTKKTDKTKSVQDRIEQCRREASQTWIHHEEGVGKVTIDYYNKILKRKWLV
jgi:hypothetical protein